MSIAALLLEMRGLSPSERAARLVVEEKRILALSDEQSQAEINQIATFVQEIGTKAAARKRTVAAM